MSASYKIETDCHCAPGDAYRCQIHDKDSATRAAAWQYRCEQAESALASARSERDVERMAAENRGAAIVRLTARAEAAEATAERLREAWRRVTTEVPLAASVALSGADNERAEFVLRAIRDAIAAASPGETAPGNDERNPR